MKAQNSSFFPKAALLLLIGCVLVTFIGLYAMLGSSGKEPQNIIIPRGSSVAQVSEILRRHQIIDHSFAFKLMLKFTGGAKRVRAGEFQFKTDMGWLGALKVLYYDEPIEHIVTMPEGWTIRQFAQILAKTGLVDEYKFANLALAKEAAAKYHFKTPSLEGFLFPDTYKFSKIDGEEKIIDIMVQHFRAKFDRSMQEKARSMNLTTEQLVTLASIIEKETGAPGERPMISSVFHNRLRKHMRLQSDPTTIYGIPDFNGNLTKKNLLTPTAYNTYTIPALPPGPIASPGYAALLAALNPATTKYLYFVSNNHGSHIFSETYAEHSRHVNTWQVDYFRKRPGQIGKVDKK